MPLPLNQHAMDDEYERTTGPLPEGHRATSPIYSLPIETLMEIDSARIRLDQVREVKSMLLIGDHTRTQIAKLIGVSRMTILAIEKGRYWYV